MGLDEDDEFVFADFFAVGDGNEEFAALLRGGLDGYLQTLDGTADAAVGTGDEFAVEGLVGGREVEDFEAVGVEVEVEGGAVVEVDCTVEEGAVLFVVGDAEVVELQAESVNFHTVVDEVGDACGF